MLYLIELALWWLINYTDKSPQGLLILVFQEEILMVFQRGFQREFVIFN